MIAEFRWSLKNRSSRLTVSIKHTAPYSRAHTILSTSWTGRTINPLTGLQSCLFSFYYLLNGPTMTFQVNYHRLSQRNIHRIGKNDNQRSVTDVRNKRSICLSLESVRVSGLRQSYRLRHMIESHKSSSVL